MARPDWLESPITATLCVVQTMMHETRDTRRRYVVDPVMMYAPQGHIGLSVGGYASRTHVRWPRLLLLASLLVAGVTLATVFGGTTSVTETAAVRNFTVAAAHFEALIGTLVTHARVPGRTDGRMACAAVLPIHLRHVETLMVEVMRWANATCFTPMFVGVPMRGVAWRRDDGDVACAMNVRLTSFSYEQSVVLEAFPGWGLDPVPVQRPHRVDIAYEDGRGETREDSVHGHAAHCVQSAVRLWGGATVHD